MRLRILALITLLLIPVSSFAWPTTKNFEDILRGWVGKDLDELAAKWGAPNRELQLNSGGKVLTYIVNTTQGGAIIPAGDVYLMSHQSWYCKVNFTVDDTDRIKEWSYTGNNCRANKSKE